LKTLLRKKACLYEPDTSRAVALVTWLVGRELVLNYGYFSRQQLQAGVHTCVSEKIKSGAITRTKVNRCMQIILNSCFHYIIPRPDGTEENGDFFRGRFAAENRTTLEQKKIKDDSFLLEVLPSPWNDIVIDKDAILAASSVEMANRRRRRLLLPNLRLIWGVFRLIRGAHRHRWAIMMGSMVAPKAANARCYYVSTRTLGARKMSSAATTSSFAIQLTGLICSCHLTNGNYYLGKRPQVRRTYGEISGSRSRLVPRVRQTQTTATMLWEC